MEKISKNILSQYKKADTFFWVNQDNDLKPIYITIPECPDISTIDGYGLDAKLQKFQRQKYPNKLRKIEKDCDNNIEDIWIKLLKNQSQYREEIEWIKLQWYYRINGYWFFNNGTPTYIDGWQFYYLNYFNIDEGLPDYRDRDRRWFLAQRFAYNDTMDFVKKDKDDIAIPESDGTYLMYDTNRKLCWGTTGLKGRRSGDTYKVLCIGLEIVSRSLNSNMGIQGELAKTGKEGFLKIRGAWSKLPFFFMPKYNNDSLPEEKISFFNPSVRSNSNKINNESGLGSMINYATTAHRGFYDTKKLIFLLDDEEGKCTEEIVTERWPVQRKCLSLGNKRVGFSIHPTTTGDFKKGGGEVFRKLCDDADYYKRNKNGETLNGLYNFYFNAADAYEGFIDEYGMSVMETPTPEQSIFIGSKIGSMEFINNTLDSLLKQGDEKSLKTYREEKRLCPTKYSDCWMSDTGDIGMPYEKIDARLSELMFDKTATKKGNFKRLNSDPEGIVIWEDDNINGRWIISLELPFNQTNKKFYSNGTYTPIEPRFLAGADTFRLNKTAGSRMSDGGGAVFWLRDKIVDPDTKDIENWTTNRFVCTYQARPPLEEYLEDMLMMCEYWGAWMNPEVNIANIIDHFNRRGRSGYLFYAIDKATGKQRNTPGYSTTGNSQPELFNLVISYLHSHCHREKHAEFLNDCKSIRGLADMTNFDRWSAAAGCLKGASEVWEAPIFQKKSTVDVRGFFNARRM